MSVALSTARLMKMPAGTPRVRRMLPTGTFGAAPRDDPAAPRCSMRHSEVRETAATAAETSSARALVRAIAPSFSEMR